MKLEIGQFVHKVGSSVLVSKDKQISMKDLIKKKKWKFSEYESNLIVRYWSIFKHFFWRNKYSLSGISFSE